MRSCFESQVGQRGTARSCHVPGGVVRLLDRRQEPPYVPVTLRLLLVIFALWILAVEPTFRAFEQIEEHSSEPARSGGDACLDADQPLPPREVVPPRWVNTHHAHEIAAPVDIDPASLALLLDWLDSSVSAAPVSTGPHLPYPPAALPLRL